MRRLLGAASVVVAIGLAAMPARADEPAPAAPASTTAPASPASSDAQTPASAQPAPPAEPPKTEPGRTAWPWIMLGTGLVLVATSAVFAGLTLHEENRREDAETKIFGLTPNDPQYRDLQTDIENRKGRASSERTTAIVVGTVGFLTIAGSILWWYFEGDAIERHDKKHAAIKPRVAPSLAPGYAGASMGFAF